MTWWADRPDDRRARDRGFTLVEILVVIVVLGILATIVVFAVRGVSDDADRVVMSDDARILATAEEAYQARFGRYGTEDELVEAKLLTAPSVLHDIALDGNSYRVVSASQPGGVTTTLAGAATTTTASGVSTSTSTTSTSASTTTTSTSTTSTTTTTTLAPTTTVGSSTGGSGSLAGVTCSLVVSNGWGAGGNADLRITNSSGANLATWTVRITPNGYGVSLWNATTTSSTSAAVLATNLSWNGGVANGSTATPTGATISGSGIATGLSLPCAVLPNTVRSANVTCAFQVSQAWGTGGNGNLTITNTNAVALSSWTVRLTLNGQAISLWSADSTSTATYLTASNQSHNASVAAGATATPTGGAVSGSGISVGMTFPCSVIDAS
jgi:prepilin-type N-terminal cleavage/methylation domain-containing protein